MPVSLNAVATPKLCIQDTSLAALPLNAGHPCSVLVNGIERFSSLVQRSCTSSQSK